MDLESRSETQGAAAGGYAGIRDHSHHTQTIEQGETIVSSNGAVIGVRNRVRDGLATFQDSKAYERRQTEDKKIVIYVTSFRGVRSTYEDCKYILSIFYNHRVRVEERDVYMTLAHYRELEGRLKEVTGTFSVPHVFINGQYIGGKDNVEKLNETGELKIILLDFPKTDILKNCSICGGYELVPCLKCGGSKNSVANNFTSEFRALKCTTCNENGLQQCPQCSKA